MLSRQDGLPDALARVLPGRGEEMPYRSGLMRVLCPECRRKVYLHEEWGY
ncbi:MAG: hypothetical protein JSU73_03260 [candidate division WOR-3 bacterium]|nr:MAG: hypothetical protein JSU73_03260 [candidate division WOR-3 bacterium]